MYNIKVNFEKDIFKNIYSYMIFDIIMNNLSRYKYMSKSKDIMSICFIELGKKIYKISRYFIFFVCSRKILML